MFYAIKTFLSCLPFIYIQKQKCFSNKLLHQIHRIPYYSPHNNTPHNYLSMHKHRSRRNEITRVRLLTSSKSFGRLNQRTAGGIVSLYGVACDASH